MKQSAFLAVGAMSLGLAGLGVLAPVVSAADAAETTVTAKVAEVFNIEQIDAIDLGNLAGAGDMKEVNSAVVANNNSGTVAHLTVNTATADNNMVYVNDDKTSNSAINIPAGTNVQAGNPSWGIKINGAQNYTIVPPLGQSQAVADINGVKVSTPITYGASNSVETRAGQYQVQVVYTLTKDAAGTDAGA